LFKISLTKESLFLNMRKRITFGLFMAILLFFNIAFAQPSAPADKAIYEYVKALGKLDSLNMGSISYTITKKYPENRDKVRAIFDWITLNISFDLKAGKTGGNEKTNTEDILKTRKATAAGYAALFQDMCSVVKIRCLTVDGYIKRTVEDINEKPDEKNHTWAVVQLGQSPDTWHYVDPTLGSGFTDDKLSKYTPVYNEQYFFANKVIFNLQYFPDNMAWQLGAGPKSLKEFLSYPLLKNDAYTFGITQFLPLGGYIKAKLNKPVKFSIKTTALLEPIQIVAIKTGNEKKYRTKTVNHTITEGNINFNFEFDTEDSSPAVLLINNKPVLVYFAEVEE
jgi:hypothetical protein